MDNFLISVIIVLILNICRITQDELRWKTHLGIYILCYMWLLLAVRTPVTYVTGTGDLQSYKVAGFATYLNG